jgi:hypothetical protein
VQLQYEITPADHLEMIKAVRASSTARLLRYCLDIFAITLGIFIYLCGDHWTGSFFVSFFLLSPIALRFLLPRWIARRRYRRNPRLYGLRTVTLDENGLISDSKIAHTEIRWESFEHFGETKNLFLLHQTKDCIGIIPKRTVSDPEQLEALRLLLRSKVPL